MLTPNHEYREKTLRKLGQISNNYNKVSKLEQNIPYSKIKNMNLDLLGSIIQGESPSAAASLSEKITYWSYTRMIGGNATIGPSEQLIKQTLNELNHLELDEAVQAISIMMKISRNVIENPSIPHKFLPQVTLSDLNQVGLSADIVKSIPTSINSILLSLANNNFCAVNLIASNIHVAEKTVIIEDYPSAHHYPFLSGKVIKIKNEEKFVALLFMRFQVFAASDTKIFPDYLESFTQNIESIVDFANKDQIKTQINNFGLIDDNDLWDYYNNTIKDEFTFKTSGFEYKSIEKDEFNKIRLNPKSVVSVSTTGIFNLDIPKYFNQPLRITIVESMQNVIFDDIYSLFSQIVPEMIEEVTMVNLILPGSITNIDSNRTFGVYFGSGTVTINKIALDGLYGQVFIANADSLSLQIEEGHLIWYS